MRDLERGCDWDRLGSGVGASLIVKDSPEKKKDYRPWQTFLATNCSPNCSLLVKGASGKGASAKTRIVYYEETNYHYEVCDIWEFRVFGKERCFRSCYHWAVLYMTSASCDDPGRRVASRARTGLMMLLVTPAPRRGPCCPEVPGTCQSEILVPGRTPAPAADARSRSAICICTTP